MARTFCSDNNSGVHPEVIAALTAANEGHAHAYGDDPWTRAGEDAIRRHVGAAAEVLLVFNGTGANVTCLQAVAGPGDAVICPATAHIATDECGAPERFTGSKLVMVDTPDGKLRPEDLPVRLTSVGVEHHSQPRAVSISQVAETGVLYDPDEVRALADACHAHALVLHMDGARIANAAVALGVPVSAFTSEAGVDLLSFGGTKNGMLGGEAVVAFRSAATERLRYLRKSSGQLASKMRYVGAQFDAMWGTDLWERCARPANAAAARLAAGAVAAGIEPLWPVQANEVFAVIPSADVPALQAIADFHVWEVRGADSVVRWVTSWDTTEEDVDRLVAALHERSGGTR